MKARIVMRLAMLFFLQLSLYGAPGKSVHSTWDYTQTKPFPEHNAVLNSDVTYTDGRHYDVELTVDGRTAMTIERNKYNLSPGWTYRRAVDCSVAVFRNTQFLGQDRKLLQVCWNEK